MPYKTFEFVPVCSLCLWSCQDSTMGHFFLMNNLNNYLNTVCLSYLNKLWLLNLVNYYSSVTQLLVDVLIKYTFHIYLILIKLRVAQLIEHIGH